MSNEPGILPEPIPFGKYYLLERISVGGMAEIYKAKAFGVEGFERLLAVKKILSSIAEDESFIEMFIDEAKIAGQLNHPNIAQIFDLGKVDGSYFIALEYISGKDLKNIFERSRRIGEQVDIPQVCYCIMKVCEGLAHAHNKQDSQGRDLNIVHRDISPQNILLSYEGEVKIIDFGIAKAQGKTSQTQVGVLKGKFSYMSPEQVRGLHVDHRSDIFSLGIVLYEMLTLERLFLGESDFDTLEKIRKVEMSPPSLYNPNIPSELEDIALKALAQNPDDRFQSASELAEALERFMRNEDYFYKNTDLAEFMKDAFREDIEFEQKKLEYYRSLDLKPPNQLEEDEVEEDGGLSWGEEEMETQIFDRNNQPHDLPPGPGASAGSGPHGAASQEMEISDSDIVYAGDAGEGSGSPQPRSNTGGVEIVGPDNEIDYVEAEPSGQAGGEFAEEGEQAPTVEYDRWEVDDQMAEGAEQAASPEAPDSSPAPPPADPEPEPRPNRRREPTAKIGTEELQRDQDQGQGPSAAKPPTSPRPGAAGGDDNFRKRLLVIGGTAAAFIVAALSLMFALSGNIFDSKAHIKFVAQENQPSDIRVFLNGDQVKSGTVPFTYDAVPGKTKIVVKSDGYKDDVRSTELKAGQTYRFKTQLKEAPPEPGEVFVDSTPSGAELSVDGEAVEDPTPVTIEELKPGKYTIVATKEGFFEVEETVEVKEGEDAELKLELKAKEVALTLESDPSRARFELFEVDSGDRIARGKTPETIEELAGDKKYRVEMSRWGYNDYEEIFEPGAETESTLSAELVKEGEEKKPVAAAGAGQDEQNQQDDPEPSGTTASNDSNSNSGSGSSGSGGAGSSDDNTGSSGSAGSSGGAGSSDDETGGEDDEPTQVADKSGNTGGSQTDENTGSGQSGDNGGGQKEPAGKGRLMINSRPAASVIINGKSVGHTPVMGYEVKAGKHTVTLKNDEFGLNKTYYPEVKDGETKKIINRSK